MLTVTLVEWQQLLDLFRCTVADVSHRMHTVEMPRSILERRPHLFRKGSDTEHIGTLAAGAVLLSMNPEERFHKLDASKVDLAYDAASKAQILGRFENK